MKNIIISFILSIIILFSMVGTSYAKVYSFIPPYYKSEDEKLMIYNTVNAARIRLANGQISASVEVTGESEIEIETVYDDAEILLIIDTSGSMSGSGIESAKRAAKELIDNLIGIPNTKIGIIEFNSNATVISEFINDKQTLENKIQSLNASGGTDLKSALDKIGNGIRFGDEVKPENRIIVTLTDGATSNASSSAEKYYRYQSEGYKLYHVLLEFGNTEAFVHNGQQVGEIYTNVSTADLSNIFEEIYDSIYSEMITVLPPHLNVETVNGQLLGDQLIFFLDNEFTQGATLEVEYVINVKVAFDCTSLMIADFLGNGFVFGEDVKLLTDPSSTNQDYSWELEQEATANDSEGRTILKYIAPKENGYVLKKGEELNIKLVVSRLLSTTGGQIGGVSDSGEGVFNSKIKMAARGKMKDGREVRYDSDTIDLEGINIVITPPWGANENYVAMKNLSIIVLFLLIVIAIVLIKIKNNKSKV